jgi:hypothetical protein
MYKREYSLVTSFTYLLTHSLTHLLTHSLTLGKAANQAVTFLGVGKELYAAKGLGGLYSGFKFKAFHLGGGGALMAFLIPFFKNIFDKL